MIDLSGVELVLPQSFVEKAIEHYINHGLRTPIEIDAIDFKWEATDGGRWVATVRIFQHTVESIEDPVVEPPAVFGARKVTVAS